MITASTMLVNVNISSASWASGMYELSATEPQRNGLPHWVLQQSAGKLAHLYFQGSFWWVSSSYRADPEGLYYRSDTGFGANVFGITAGVGGAGAVAFSVSPACPTSSYAQGSGLATTCSACGAYQFAPRGSISAAACKCAPGAGLLNASSTTCAPCTGDTFRASAAANAVCNACPVGTYAIDGAQAPAACVMPSCDQITV